MAYLNGEKVIFAYIGEKKAGPPIVVRTAAKMDEILANATAVDNGTIFKYIGVSTDKYDNNAYYVLEV